MEKMLHNYSHFRIDATSGLDAASANVLHIPNLNFYHEKKDDIIWKKHWSGNYTFKELATCMSHLKAIREAYERGDNMALILEDDAVLDLSNMDKNMNHFVESAPEDWEILQLFVQHMKLIGHYNHMSDPWVFWHGKNWGATAYVINRRGMRKLLEKMYKGNSLTFEESIVVADEVVFAHLNAYTATFPYVSISGDSSQIQNDKSMANEKYRMQMDRLIHQKSEFPLDTTAINSDFSLCVITNIIDVETFMEDKRYMERWHGKNIIWNALKPCRHIVEGVRCIDSEKDADHADYVLLKSPHIRLPGFAWKTFWSKASATISGTLYSVPSEGQIYTKFIKYQPNRDDTFFEHIVYTIGSGYPFITVRRNRGAFTYITPFETDVVLQRFALLNGSFARWFFNKSTEDRFEVEWCGAATNWNPMHKACHVIPIGIRQAILYHPTPRVKNFKNEWVKYSQEFRSKYMKLRDHKFWFSKTEEPFHSFRQFTEHKGLLTQPLVTRDDRIMTTFTYRSPIVLRKYKWIIFTVQKIASSTQKKLIRRILGPGCSDGGVDPQNEYDGCFTLLRDYDTEEATRIMHDPTWTKSIFLRDPYERVLSAYLHMRKNNYTRKYCQNKSPINFTYFLEDIVQKCDRGTLPDPHFGSQYDRVTEKWWPYMNFVSTLDNFSTDFPKLLKKLGLWSRYGKAGWGPSIVKHFYGNQSIVANNELHKTSAKKKMEKYYTQRNYDFVSNFYRQDIDLYNQINQLN
tara:strand:- start:4615 stop:6846 length:2232 start_codon:yes stop_codon:yes gene_type:complete